MSAFFCCSFLSDLLWAKSVVLTQPLIATLGQRCICCSSPVVERACCGIVVEGLSLTIPLAMLSDVIFHGKEFTALYFVGSALVVSGFVLVNWRYSRELRESEK